MRVIRVSIQTRTLEFTTTGRFDSVGVTTKVFSIRYITLLMALNVCRLQSLAAMLSIRWILVSLTFVITFGFPACPRGPLQRSSLLVRHMIFSRTNSKTDRDTLVQEVLALSRTIGPIGIFASVRDQQSLEQLALSLKPFSDKNPTQRQLRGKYSLLYSAAPGRSSGRLAGPFYGAVTQEFIDNDSFINAVQFGPLKISLRATRTATSHQKKLGFNFRQTTVQLFGQTVLQKDIGGGGVWDYLFIGEITDTDGIVKLVRVMKAPSLFILEQPLHQ